MAFLPTTDPDSTPAPDGAGGCHMSKEGKGLEDEHMDAAVLVSRLEAFKILYRDLVKQKMGTNVIESGAMRQV